MKKQLVTALLLSSVLVISLTSCGTSANGTPDSGTDTTASAPTESEDGSDTDASGTDDTADSSASDADTTDPSAPPMDKDGSAPDAPNGEGGPNGKMGGPGNGGPKAGGGGMGAVEKDDPELKAMLDEVEELFSQQEYTDEKTGLTVPYNLYLPDDYETVSYPMVTFIADMSVVGRDTTAPLEQGYGGIIWAAAENQKENPCVVLVPEFPETIITDSETTDYVDLVPRMVQSVAADNNVDTKRLYATGQSMGCMTFLHAAATNPGLFAAELFVSGQQPADQLQGLEMQNFIYITAGGDNSASGGADDLMALFDQDKITYSYSDEWDAKADADALNAKANELLAEGNDRNFARFATGTVLSDDSDSGPMASEHMASFDYAYKIDALRSWLFTKTL